MMKITTTIVENYCQQNIRTRMIDGSCCDCLQCSDCAALYWPLLAMVLFGFL